MFALRSREGRSRARWSATIRRACERASVRFADETLCETTTFDVLSTYFVVAVKRSDFALVEMKDIAAWCLDRFTGGRNESNAGNLTWPRARPDEGELDDHAITGFVEVVDRAMHVGHCRREDLDRSDKLDGTGKDVARRLIGEGAPVGEERGEGGIIFSFGRVVKLAHDCFVDRNVRLLEVTRWLKRA